MANHKQSLNYGSLLSDISNLDDAAVDKGLAKLGDEIINMGHSLAQSLYFGYATGEKVNATVLAESMKNADLRDKAKLRAKTHDIADSAEAIVAYAYLLEKINVDEIVEILLAGFNEFPEDVKTRKQKRECSIFGHSKLLSELKKRLEG